MRYLLDVNVLIAHGITRHQMWSRVETWLASMASTAKPELATCSITELGFIRIVSQIPAYNVTLDQARAQLELLKTSQTYDFKFLVDDHDISKLPAWVTTAKHTTDGHLAELAKTNGFTLATLDENLPGAFVIPNG